MAVTRPLSSCTLTLFGLLDDLAHMGVEHDVVAEFGGDFQGDLLAAADEAFFLGAFGGLEVTFEGAGVVSSPEAAR